MFIFLKNEGPHRSVHRLEEHSCNLGPLSSTASNDKPESNEAASPNNFTTPSLPVPPVASSSKTAATASSKIGTACSRPLKVSQTFGIRDGDVFDSLDDFKGAVFREAIKEGWTPRTTASCSIDTARRNGNQAYVRLACQPGTKSELCKFTLTGRMQQDNQVYVIQVSSVV